MSCRVFLAGAAGAIGRRLAPLLRDAGHHVVGTTRSPEKAASLQRLGISPVLVDVFDAEALLGAVLSARPEIVIHQLTDLPPGLDPSLMAAAVIRNARIREDGTENLVRAALAAGARRLIAQSVAWMYAPGREPHDEDDPLAPPAEGAAGTSLRGVMALEHRILNIPPVEGIVLRYGQLDGPGTGSDTATGTIPLHVDAAAHAALLAIDHGAVGVFNVAEPNALVTTEKASRELGWDASFRLS